MKCDHLGWKLLLLVTVIGLLLTLSMHSAIRQNIGVSAHKISIYRSEKRTRTKEIPIILWWFPPWDAFKWILPKTPLCGGGCIMTGNRSKLEESDAVVFFMMKTTPDVLKDRALISKRRPDQVFVWWNSESPWTVKHYWHQTLSEFNGFYNWTMHYRVDSDVCNAMIPATARDWFLNSVGKSNETDNKRFIPTTNETTANRMLDELLKVKTKGTAWVVTDCNWLAGATERMKFAKRLRDEGKYPIDIYGGCGKPLPRVHSIAYNVLRQYKFYLAFENAQGCQDYITEKFWYNSFYAGLVPVVWGPSKANVAQMAPPDSFIHAEDFNFDPKRLTEFLRKLEKDDESYRKYFRWWWSTPNFYPIFQLREPEDKRNQVQEDHFDWEVNGFCHLCKKLHEGEHLSSKKVISNLREHFFGKEDPKCYD